MSGRKPRDPADSETPHAGVEHDLRRIRTLLGLALRVRKLDNRTIEHRLGSEAGYLADLLTGKSPLLFDELYGILEILEIEPADFFALVFRDRH